MECSKCKDKSKLVETSPTGTWYDEDLYEHIKNDKDFIFSEIIKLLSKQCGWPEPCGRWINEGYDEVKLTLTKTHFSMAKNGHHFVWAVEPWDDEEMYESQSSFRTMNVR